MADGTPRLRMIAGPNGSGKSTIKSKIPPEYIVLFLNADEIESHLRQTNSFNFANFGVSPSETEVLQFFSASSQLAKSGINFESWEIALNGTSLQFNPAHGLGYLAATLADFARVELLKAKRSFTFETVMSHKSKIEFLHEAQLAGYRTYLYFVGTDDVEINLARIQNRVAEGGHSVQEAKVRKRYRESMDLLFDAIQFSNRAFIFDNSEENGDAIVIAEFADGTLNYIQEEVPEWFGVEYLDKELK